MPDKNKSAADSRNTQRRTTKPEATRLARKPDPAVQPVAKPVTKAVSQAVPKGVSQAVSKAVSKAEAPSAACKQLAVFEAAMRLFHARKLTEARVLFQQAAAGAERDVAQRAQLHTAMCDRRLQQTTVSFGTAEECYNYGIALINSRNVAEARTHLEKALAIAPGSDHIHYALALAQALGGDLANAHENLRRAIELEPRNRLMARQDADFAPLANQASFRSLLYPEKISW